MSRYSEAELLTPEQAEELAARLPVLRGEHTQAWLAFGAGLDVSTIAHAEDRGARPTTVTAGKIAAALGLSLEDLTGGAA
jgi:hypothetical protein